MESLFYSPKNNIYIGVSPIKDNQEDIFRTVANYGAEFIIFMNKQGVMDAKSKELFYRFIEGYDTVPVGNVEKDIIAICKELREKGFEARPVYNNAGELGYRSKTSLFGDNIVGFMVISNKDILKWVLPEKEEKEIIHEEEMESFLNLLLSNYSDACMMANIGDVALYNEKGEMFHFKHHVRFDETIDILKNISLILLHSSFEQDNISFLGKYSDYSFGMALKAAIKDKRNAFDRIEQIIDTNGNNLLVGLSGCVVTLIGDDDIKNIELESEEKAEEVYDLVHYYKTADIEEYLIEENILELLEEDKSQECEYIL